VLRVDIKNKKGATREEEQREQEGVMGNVIIGATLSLDGFMNDRHGDVSRLYPDLQELRSTAMLQEEIRMTGAVVMGRRAYDMAGGDLTDYEYQVPIFVLTHHLPEQVPKGQNDQLTVTFVTDGIQSAIKQAQAAAGDKQVTVVGGANTAQQ
jgi:dihydrofolate reductase